MGEEVKKAAKESKDKESARGEGQEEAKKEVRAPAELSGSKKVAVMVFIIAGIIAVLSAVSFFIIMSLKPEDPEIMAERIKKQKEELELKKETEVGETLPEPLLVLVNLAGPDADRFLKADLVLEYTPKGEAEGGGGGHGGEGAAKAPPEIQKRLPKLKDIAIGVLSSCTLEDVKDRDAKKKVLTRLKNEMNKVFPEPETITNVYFASFIIQ